MENDKKFISGRIKSIKYALKGFWTLLSTEHSIMAQFGLFVIVVGLGFFYEISAMEWVAQILGFGLIFSAEGLNTAIEEIADFIHPEFHKKIGKIKDIAAGAVTFAALTTFVVILIIYIPKIFA